mmetsp:Transcript_19935/g.35426  ORF Transcript_19935/g.35426 Transcript_19935/m.35426 type:complete len:473 (-) Transcript_19935:581-1999(-)
MADDELSNLLSSYYGAKTPLSSSKARAKGVAQVLKSRSEKIRNKENVGESVWAPHIETPHAELCSLPKAEPVVEEWLQRTIRKIHAQLEKLCVNSLDKETCGRLALKSSVTLRNGDAVFEKWLLNAQSASNQVGLIPTAAGVNAVQKLLVADLAQACVDQPSRVIVASIVRKFCSWYTSFVQKMVRPDPQSKKNARRKVRIEEGEKRVTVSFGTKDLKIGLPHFLKLKELYQRAGGRERDFPCSLYSLLQRYDSLGGAGFQAAIGPRMFEALEELFKVNFECFASPLNCRYEAYCSAFPDTDAAFGSRGSFFAFEPNEGSFEANPPFVDETVALMAKHMFKLLKRSEKKGLSLRFIVIVPAKYTDTIQAEFSSNEGLYRGSLVLDNREHSYLPGAQQSKKRRAVASTCDTAIHVLATTPAAEECPFDEDAKRYLTDAMSSNAMENDPSRGKDGLGGAKEERKRPKSEHNTVT